MSYKTGSITTEGWDMIEETTSKLPGRQRIINKAKLDVASRQELKSHGRACGCLINHREIEPVKKSRDLAKKIAVITAAQRGESK